MSNGRSRCSASPCNCEAAGEANDSANIAGVNECSGLLPKAASLEQTTWILEGTIIARFAAPLIAISLLDLSQRLIPIIMSGHLGSRDLAAVSLAMTTAQFTGYSLYQGLATSLDTMCAQAFGKGRRILIGLYVQRMTLCLLVATVPVALVWYWSTEILTVLVPDPELAAAAGRYLRILILGAPGYACYESGKRYTQTQGSYSAIACTLLTTSALNVLLSYHLVWTRNTGFLGLSVSLVVTQTTLPILLAIFTRYLHGCEHWPRPSRKIFQNWSVMLQVSIPGMIMLMADTVAFEALSLASAQLGTSYLAANMILLSITNFAFRFPTGIAIASGTRVAHLVGAGSLTAVKVAIRVAFGLAACIGLFNGIIIILFRSAIVAIFSDDKEVAALATKTCLVIGVFQMVDTAVAQCEKLLYGLGRQRFGAVVSTLAYIVIGVPASISLTFGMQWGLYGLWSGLLLALVAMSVLDSVYLGQINVEAVVVDASARLSQDD